MRKDLMLSTVIIIGIAVAMFVLLGSILDLDTLLFAFRLFFVMLILGITIWNYYKYRNSILIYLIIAITSLLSSDFIGYFLQIDAIVDLDTQFLLSLAINNILVILSLFFFLLFFEAFNSDNLINKTNTVLLIFVSGVSTGLVLSAFFVKSKLDLISQNTSTQNSRNTSTTTASRLSFIDYSIYFFIGLSIILIVVLIVQILRTMNKKIKNAVNPNLKKLLKQMRMVSLIVMIGPLLPYIVMYVINSYENISRGLFGSSLLSSIGLGLMMYLYQKGGIFLLQNESLRRIIIINNAGIPVYSYKFREFKDTTNSMDSDTQEILFSGALSSISALLSEFSGSDQRVRSITLENLSMIINSVHNYSIIVMADQNTKFYHEAVSQIISSIKPVLAELKERNIFDGRQIAYTDNLIEKTFGLGYLD